ncbi:glycine oxidase ThiO [Paenibacillus oryzisoli]|uniref:glycine oxidase ThiO n=1 Tax=Paenibacillus oryzisoli TaxID=1850517 RepID=UPI003D2AE32D
MSGKLTDVLIVGGGVIGTSIAYYLAKKGASVTLLDRGRLGTEASSAAAGMLGAQSEMEDDGALFQWARRSRSMFPALSEELKALTGLDIGLVREGLLNVALSDVQEAELRARALWQRAAGERAEWLDASAACELEPALSTRVRGALYLPDDGQVEAPKLAAAFAQAAITLGANVREFAPVSALLAEGGRVTGVMTPEGPLYSSCVVVAAGTWSGQLLQGIGAELPMYPVKGECFSVLTPKPLLHKTLFTPGCYVVPKAGGRVLVGATVKPYSYDRKVSLAGLQLLMARAQELMPELAGAEWERAWSGLRPQSGDGLPYIGAVPQLAGLYTACGHYRNGILLSPITGQVMANLIAEGSAVDDEEEDEEQLVWQFADEGFAEEAGGAAQSQPGWRSAEAGSTQDGTVLSEEDRLMLDAFVPDVAEGSKRASLNKLAEKSCEPAL